MQGFYTQYRGKREEQLLVEYARAGFTSYEGVEEVPRKPFHFIHATEVGEVFIVE